MCCFCVCICTSKYSTCQCQRSWIDPHPFSEGSMPENVCPQSVQAFRATCSLPLRGWGMVNCFLLARTGSRLCFCPRLSFCWVFLCCTMRLSFCSRSCEREMNWGLWTSSASWLEQRTDFCFLREGRPGNNTAIWFTPIFINADPVGRHEVKGFLVLALYHRTWHVNVSQNTYLSYFIVTHWARIFTKNQ